VCQKYMRSSPRTHPYTHANTGKHTGTHTRTYTLMPPPPPTPTPTPTPTHAPTHTQVCLAAETCGHVGFSILGDTWYSAEPLHCTSGRETASGADEVSYWELYRKVCV